MEPDGCFIQLTPARHVLPVGKTEPHFIHLHHRRYGFGVRLTGNALAAVKEPTLPTNPRSTHCVVF